MRKSVRQAPTAGEQTQQTPFRTSSDIEAERENHTVRQGLTLNRKGLIQHLVSSLSVSDRPIPDAVLTQFDLLRMCKIIARNMYM
jgi:hypothetical protein